MIIRPPPKLTNRSSIVKYIEIDLWSWLKQLTTTLIRLTSSSIESNSGIVLIQKQTVSDAPNIVFKDNIDTTYSTYMVVISNMVPKVFNTSFGMLISTTSGNSYLTTGYNVGVNYADYTSNTWVNNNGTNVMFASGGIADTGPGLNAVLNLYNISTSNSPIMSGHGTEFIGIPRFAVYTGYNSTTSRVSALKFQFATGNIAKGTISLFGIK